MKIHYFKAQEKYYGAAKKAYDTSEKARKKS